MPVKYLLKCRCGKKVPVTQTQAGQRVGCSCGLEIQVPNLMELKQLEVMEEASTTRSSSMRRGNPDAPGNWGVAQGLVTAGVLLSLLAAGWLFYVIHGKPPTPKEMISDEYIAKVIDNMTLIETFREWSVLRHDIRLKRSIDNAYLTALAEYKIRFWVAVILLGVGVCFTVITIIFERRTACRQPDTEDEDPSSMSH